MKKSILFSMAAMLLCALLCVSVFAAGGSTVSLKTNADAETIYAEGEEIEVYFLVGPMVKVGGSGSNIKSVARLVGDPSDANRALTTNKNLSAFAGSVTYSTDDFVYVGAEYIQAAPTSATAAAKTTGVDAYPVYVFYGGAYNGANVFVPTVTVEDGKITFDFGTNTAAGFGLNHSSTPEYGMIAKLTFRVAAGAAGGDVEFGMTTNYTVSGMNYEVIDNVTVSVAEGCEHPEAQRTEIEHDGNRTMTCYQSEIQWYHCAECGNDFFVETETTIAHDYAEEYTYLKEPTCTVSGAKARYCQNEGCTTYDADSTQTVDRLGHDFADEYVYSVASCTETGYAFWYCSRCGVLSKDGKNANTDPYTYFNPENETYWLKADFTTSVDVTADPRTYFAVTPAFGHDYEQYTPENAEPGAVYYRCKTDPEHTLKLAADMLKRYVSEDGVGSGLSVADPTSLKAAYEHFATLPADVNATLYLCGERVTVSPSSYTVDVHEKAFEEAAHRCHVTVTSVNMNNKTELFFPFASCSMYILRGPETFENIKIISDAKGSSASNSESITIAACGNKLVMGDGLEMPNMAGKDTINAKKEDGSFSAKTALSLDIPNSKIYLLGGYYGEKNSGPVPESYDVDLTVKSGTYWCITLQSRDRMTLRDSTLNFTAAGEFTAAYFYPANNCDFTNVTINVHYKAPATIVFLYRGVSGTNSSAEGYTINHVFYKGSQGMKIGDTMMAGKVAHEVHVAYPADVQQSGNKNAYDLAKAFVDKGNSNPFYIELLDLTTIKEWCVKYNGGHCYENGACTVCGLAPCATHTESSEVFLRSPATCVSKSVWYTRCSRCYEDIKVYSPEVEEVGPHGYQPVIEGQEVYFVCSHDSSHVTEKRSLRGLDTIYVSESGSGDGGFSKDNPQSNFMSAFSMAAALSTDAHIVVLGKANVVPEYSQLGFIEPKHRNHITVGGTEDGMGILDFSSTGSYYHLNGDTTFEYVEFTNGKKTTETTIIAWHHHLTMGEHISMDFMRTTNQNSAGSRFNIVGGCHNSQVYGSCAETDVHLTISGGNYFKIYGGACSQAACGVAKGTIYLDFDGDFTVGGGVNGGHGYTAAVLALGGYGAACGDIVLNVRGNVTCRNALLLGPYGTSDKTPRTAKNITVNIYSGSIVDYSFAVTNAGSCVYDQTYNDQILATGGAKFADATTTVIFPFGSNWEFVAKGKMDTYFQSLTVNYDPASVSARLLANRFQYAYGDRADFALNEFDDDPCPANANGSHRASETWDHAGYEDIEATCALAGISWYRCADCGKVYFETEEKLAHTYGEEIRVATAATCLSPTVYARSCLLCNHADRFLSETDTELGVHKYENNVCIYCNQANDCAHEHCGASREVKDGCSTVTVCDCEDCGAEVVLSLISVPHEFGKYTVTVVPTDTTPGVKTRKCKNCGKIETAIIYPNSAYSDEVFAVTGDGSAADFSVDALKLSKTEKAALNALLQDTAYGSEVKVSYTTKGDVITGVTYSIPVPAEYKDMQNVMIVIKDDNGTLRTVEFTIEKGYFVFSY